MCVHAANGVELQCKREYWAATGDTNREATQIHLLTSEQRKNIPTNNLNCERYLAKFGYLAGQSAVHSNNLFKGKRIKDDLMLIDGNVDAMIEKSMRETMKNLDEIEIVWSTKQKEKKMERLKKNMEKKSRANDFVD